MHLLGLPAATLLTVGALAGGAVVVLYILKLRRRPIAVPYSRIWQRILRDKEATSLFSQLKRLLSLLLQLLMIALLVLALGDPRNSVTSADGRNIVVLLDGSASMKATDVYPTRFDVAKDKIRAMVRGLSGKDRMLIAQMDAATTPLTTLTSELSELEAGLSRAAPTDSAADFPRGLRFATDTLRGLTSAEVIVVSDGVLGPATDNSGAVHLGNTTVSYVPIGERGRNAAITAFSVRRYPLDKSRYEVMLEVTNTADEPLDVEIAMEGDGQLIDLTRLRLGPKERLPRFYPNLSGASKTLEAKLSLAGGTHDDLAADDHAYALLPERRRARVQVVTPGNMYLEAALLLDEYLDVTTVPIAKYPAPGTFDVTIFDSVAPPVAPGSGSVLYLNPSGTSVPFEVGKELKDDDPSYQLGFDELDSKSPLLRYTSLSDIHVARAHILKGTREDKLVAKSFKGTLLLQGTRSGTKFVALGFDVRDSDFPLRAAWPLFLLNTINDFVEEDTSYISSFRTGSVWNIPVPSAALSATIELPDGGKRVVPVKEGRAVMLGLQAGFYKLTTDAAPNETSMFAANLVDASEGAIHPVRELVIEGRTAGPVAEFHVGVRREIWIYLLLAVLVMTTLEWITYHRRITV